MKKDFSILSVYKELLEYLKVTFLQVLMFEDWHKMQNFIHANKSFPSL